MGKRGIRRRQLLDDVKEKRAQIIRSLMMVIEPKHVGAVLV